MIWPLLLLAAAPDRVVLRLEEAADVGSEERQAVIRSLSDAFERRLGKRVLLDEPTWPCEEKDRCLAEIRAKTAADRVVFLRILGGSRHVQLSLDEPGNTHIELRLPKSEIDRPEVYDPVARQLFPQQAVALPPPAPPAASSSGLPVVALALAGASGVALGIGVVFGVGSQNAGDAWATSPMVASAYEAPRASEEGRSTGANVCFALAGTLAVGAVVSWLLGAP